MSYKNEVSLKASLTHNTSISSRCMILAAGYGKRLHPLTLTTPKPLIDIHGETLLGYHLRHLKTAHFKNVVINTHYLAEHIHTYMDAYSPLPYDFSYEENLLETGGGLLKALHYFDNPFLSVNSDAYTSGDLSLCYETMIDTFVENDMDALLLLAPRKNVMGYEALGDFFGNFSNESSRDFSISQKSSPLIFRDQHPHTSHLFAPYVYVGIQILHPRIFEGCQHGAFSIAELWRKQQKIGRLYGILDKNNIWFDTGNHHGLSQARKNKNTKNVLEFSSYDEPFSTSL